MTERPFEALGLSADADRAYPLLIATRGVAGRDLARKLGVSPERAEAACRELASRDLVRLGPDGHWYPLPPQSGLLPLVARAQEQLRYGRELLDRLGVEYQRVHEGHRAEEIVQVVEGAAAVRRRVGEAQAQARAELAILARPSARTTGDDVLACPAGAGTAPGHGTFATAGAGPAADATPPRLLRRVLVERAGLEALGDLASAVADTTHIRVAERVPVRMCIADRALALLPLATDAPLPDPVLLVIRPSGLLDALTTLFDTLWAAGVPLVRPDPERPRDALRLRILAMLVSGSTDAAMARSLGVAVRTVQRHIAAMQRAAGVDNRVQLVWHAARNNWLDDSRSEDDR